MDENYFARLFQNNVNEHVEKKGDLSYLSWAWAVDQLLRNDPDANWEYHEPVRFGDTLTAEATVQEVMLARHQVHLAVACRNQSNEVVRQGRAVLKILKEVVTE